MKGASRSTRLNRKRLALLWRAQMKIERRDIFGDRDRSLMPVKERRNAKVMSPGFVGPHYCVNGVVLLGGNPGGGTDTFVRRPHDRLTYPAYRRLQSAKTDVQVEDAFAGLTRAYIEAIPKWRMWTIIEPCLQAVGRDLHEVAILNAVPYRTRRNRPPRSRDIELSYRLFLGPKLAFLQPQIIVALGDVAKKALQHHYDGSAERFYIPRTNGDRYVDPCARRTLRRIRRKFRGRRKGLFK